MTVGLFHTNQDRLAAACDVIGFPDGGSDGHVPLRRNADQAAILAMDFEALAGGTEHHLQDRVPGWLGGSVY